MGYSNLTWQGNVGAASHATSRLRDLQPESAWSILTHVTCDHRETATESEEQHITAYPKVLLYCNVFGRCPDLLHATPGKMACGKMLCRHTHIYMFITATQIALNIRSITSHNLSVQASYCIFIPSFPSSVPSVLAVLIPPANHQQHHVWTTDESTIRREKPNDNNIPASYS